VNINLLRRTYVRGVTEFTIGICTKKLSADMFLEFPKTCLFIMPASPLALLVCISELVLVCTLEFFTTPVHARLRETGKLSGLRGSSVSDVALNGLHDWDSILAGDRIILRTYCYS
jgi:hypothetical protein